LVGSASQMYKSYFDVGENPSPGRGAADLSHKGRGERTQCLGLLTSPLAGEVPAQPGVRGRSAPTTPVPARDPHPKRTHAPLPPHHGPFSETPNPKRSHGHRCSLYAQSSFPAMTVSEAPSAPSARFPSES